MSAMPSGKVLILSDGGPVSLLACTALRARVHRGSGRPARRGLKEAPVDAAVLPFPPTRPRHDAHVGQCELFTLPVLAPGAGRDDPAMPRGEAESHDLLAATHLAARNGFTTVLWPATAGAGEGLDLDRIAARSPIVRLLASPWSRSTRISARCPFDPHRDSLRGLHRSAGCRPDRGYGTPHRDVLVVGR